MYPPQPPAFAAPPARPASTGSPGRLAAAFVVGGAVTTAAALLLTIPLPGLQIEFALDQWLLKVVDLFIAVILGVLVALVFLIAKARGPVAPIVAAVCGLLADQVARLVYGTGVVQDVLQVLPLVMSSGGPGGGFHGYAHFDLMNWFAVLLVPVVAGGLTALFTLFARKPAPLPPRFNQPR